MEYSIVRLSDVPEMEHDAAMWFHEKWNIPLAAYLESMDDCLLRRGAVPQWYLAVAGDRIIGGMGVIENDFHDRRDLAPNVCAVYTEPDCRRRGVAGKLLDVFERFAEGNHLAFLSLEVRASNYAAIALYGQHGYRGVGRRRNYYEHPKEDAVIMTREFGEAAK